MKKKFIFLLIFAIMEIVLLIVSIFMDPTVRLIMVATVIAVPLALPIAYFIFLLHPIYGPPSAPNSPVDIHKPLIQNRSAFLKAQPFFCAECKKFTDIMREYCEFCGTQNSLRKAKKQDFNDYIKSKN